ncbi:DUF1272 domain-containing protein [Streptomyces sp. QHH-9511]
MRDLCGRCETAALTPDGSARICSDECSFCGPCAPCELPGGTTCRN